MKKVSLQILIGVGLLLSLVRIATHLLVVKFKFDPGYFIDIFIFVYLYIWLLFKKPKQVYSILYLLFINFTIAVICIVTYDLFLIGYKSQSIDSNFLKMRGWAAVQIFELTLISSVFYYITQSILRTKWEDQAIEENSIDLR